MWIPDNDVPDTQAALAGACDIVAETWSEDVDARAELLVDAMGTGQVVSRVKRGKDGLGKKFEVYFDHRESVGRIPSHRFLGYEAG